MEDGSHLQELLEALETGILSLERDREADPAVAIHRLFQSAHNLKSGLAMAGLERASKRFHGLEDGLDDIRRGRLAWTTAWADAILDTVDRIRPCLDAGSDDGLDPLFVAPEAQAVRAPVQAEDTEAAARAAAQGQNLYRIEKLFLPGLSREDFEGHMIYDDIRDSGSLMSVRPDFDGYARNEGETVVRFLFSSTKSAEELAQLFFDPLIPVDGVAPSTGPAPWFRQLVVDDDDTMALVIGKSIESFGPVTRAVDGAQGAAEFCRAFDAGEPYDVVILDLEMPEVDGHGALQAIRDHEESHGVHGLDRCLVFMNTSNSDLTKVRASFRLQADRYFIKPLSVDKIKKSLEESLPWLETRRKQSVKRGAS